MLWLLFHISVLLVRLHLAHSPMFPGTQWPNWDIKGKQYFWLKFHFYAFLIIVNLHHGVLWDTVAEIAF